MALSVVQPFLRLLYLGCELCLRSQLLQKHLISEPKSSFPDLLLGSKIHRHTAKLRSRMSTSHVCSIYIKLMLIFILN